MASPKSDLPTLPFADPEAFAAWLTAHPSAPGLWVRFAKPAANTASITKSEAIDVALCFGWVDGQLAPLDDAWWLTRFTPRKARSKWSEVNVRRAEALIASGRMRPTGQAEIDKAKADGRWAAAYAPATTIAVPDDLAAALEANPAAKTFFATLKGANRYAVLYRLHHAKRAETRAKRLAEFVAMLERGETLH